jgi:predicted nucleic acid-binding protein
VSAAFFDTNIIIYAADSDAAAQEKRDTCRRLLRSRVVTISTQVMMETYGVLRRKLQYGADEATIWVQTLKEQTVVSLSADDVMQGIWTARRHDLSHWDGMIIRAAERAGVGIVYSEDMKHGQNYGNVRVCNPFIEDFLEAA